MRAFSTIGLPEPRLELSEPGLYRIAAMVEGEEVFFESSLPLSSGAESLACAFLLPAMARGARLEVEGAVGARFLANLEFVRRRARQWWPELSAGEVVAPVRDDAPLSADAGVFYSRRRRLRLRAAAAPHTAQVRRLHRGLRRPAREHRAPHPGTARAVSDRPCLRGRLRGRPEESAAPSALSEPELGDHARRRARGRRAFPRDRGRQDVHRRERRRAAVGLHAGAGRRLVVRVDADRELQRGALASRPRLRRSRAGSRSGADCGYAGRTSRRT